MYLTLPLESFDDNKVLKIVNFQLDMLIFVQVYKTIDKILCLLKAWVLEEQMRAMESTRRKLYAFKEKCS